MRSTSFSSRIFQPQRCFLTGLLLLVSLAIVTMTASASLAGPSEEGRGGRRPVILVAGVCSVNPAQSLAEIYQWLQEDLGYHAGEIILFDYRDATPLASASETYQQSDTVISIDGAGGSAANLRAMIIALAAEGNQFDIVAHSQGEWSASTPPLTTRGRLVLRWPERFTASSP